MNGIINKNKFMKNNINLVSKKFNYDGVNYDFWGIKDEHIYKQIPWYEEKLLNHIKNLNITGSYIDIGANIGNHSLFFINHCKSDKVIAFEPEIICFNILNKNLKYNTQKEYELYNIAVWDKFDKLNLEKYKTNKNTGISKVNKYINGDNLINGDSLDNLITSKEKIGLIKIDVEDSEIKVINGGINLIKKNKPVIICEASTTNKKQMIDNILIPLGYNTPQKSFNVTPTYIYIPNE